MYSARYNRAANTFENLKLIKISINQSVLVSAQLRLRQLRPNQR